MGPVPSLSKVCPELTSSLLLWADSFPVGAGISAGPGPPMVVYNSPLTTGYFHVSLRPVVPGPLADAITHDNPLPPLNIDGTPAYAVRSLLDSQRHGGQLQ